MKLNFRKIASVLSSAVMVSSTVALAAAASYPAPFVQNGNADVAVVWGSTATLDNAAVTNLVADLNSEVTPGTGSTTTVTGESFTLQKANNKFNLDESMNTIYTTLDLEDLPTLLADGEYDADDDTEYSQEITLGNKAISHFQDDDFNDGKPVIGFDFVDGDHILNYTLEFDSAVNVEQDTDLIILGKKYYIADNSSSQLTLLDASASQRINEGDTVTVEATNGKTYSVKLDFVEDDDDNDEANFIINDESIDAMEAGDTEEVEEGVYIVVDKVSYVDSDTRPSYAQFSLGTGKLVLEDGQEVELNDDPLSSSDEYEDHLLTADFSGTLNSLTSITLKWEANGDVWLAPGTDLVLPGFGGLKVSMGEFVQGEYEETTLEGSSDALYLKTEIAQGEISLPILHQSDDGIIDAIGKDTDEELVTRASSPNTGVGSWRYGGATSGSSGGALTVVLNDSLDSTFVASWNNGDDEGDTYVFKLKNIDLDTDTGDTEVTLDNLVSGESDLVLSEVGDDASIGEIDFELVDANETVGYAKINISSSSNIYLDRVFTKSGLTVFLPVLTNVTTAYPLINISNGTSSDAWKANFTEEDEDNKLTNGGSFAIALSTSADDGIYPTSLDAMSEYETEEDSEVLVGYVESDVATKVELDETADVKKLSIMYPGEESYAEVMVAESGATVEGGPSGNIVPIFDTDSIPTDKNLIVVGGSCVNTLAAQLLGLPANSCGSAWQTKTGVGNGQFLIQTFARDGGNVATLVAGYNMEDTANAVNALKTEASIDISANKKYVGTGTTVSAAVVA